MRILKKSLALLVALTMVLSLVVVNVSAAAGTKYELNVGSATILKGAEAQVVDIPITIETDAVGIVTLTVTITPAVGSLSDLTADMVNMALLGPVPNKDTGKIVMSGSMNQTFAAGTSMALAKVSVPAETAVGEYAVNLTVDQAKYVNESSSYSNATFTVNAGKITVTEEQWISSTEAVALGDIKYGATAPALPATVKGLGKTSGGTAITADTNVALNVTWGTIDTFVAPEDGLSVAGTVTTAETDLLKYKNAEGTAIAAPAASATYDIIKTDAGVVAPVTVEVKKKSDGTAIDLAAIKALDELEAFSATVVTIEGGAEEGVTLDWENATLYDAEDATLDTSLDENESIKLNVPVTGETTYYDLTGKVAVATITMVPAEISGENVSVKISGATTADDMVKVKVQLPADALATTPVDGIYGAGYKAVWTEAKAAIDSMTVAMGRDSSNAANVDNKTMYVGIDNLESGATYSVKAYDPEGEEVTFGEGNVMAVNGEWTAVKSEVVFYWTFNTENPDGATEDVAEGIYTIEAYKGDELLDVIHVTVGESDVIYGEPVEYTGTFTLAIDKGDSVLEEHDYAKDFVIGTGADVTVEDGIAYVTLEADKKLSDILSTDSIDTVFTTSVYYNNAALLVDGAQGVEGTIIAVGDTSVGGIGNPINNPSPMTPVTPDKEDTEEPGTEEPGTEEPGTDAPVAEGPFADVAADHWAASYIETLKTAGIVGGINDTDFAPDADITRAEYAKMVANIFGLEATSTESAFTDCPADAWFTPYVAACTEAGYILGVSETEFAPEALITREQACAILGRALNAAAEGELTFTDAAEVEEYAKAYIAALVEMGLVNGYEDGTFAPKNNITRAEAAKIIAGAYAKVAPAEEAAEEVAEEAAEEAAEEVAAE